MAHPVRAAGATLAPVRSLLALLAALLISPLAPAAALSDLSQDPLDRAAILAAPSIYRLQATVTLDALRTEDGRRVELPPRARRLSEVGTAFAIAPDGTLAAAAHVAAPTPVEMARDARLLAQALAGEPHSLEAAEEWVEQTGARPVGASDVELSVTPAHVIGARDGDGPGEVPARPIGTERSKDLALVRIDAVGAPALALHDVRTFGTGVTMLGFGRDIGSDRPGTEPRIERGKIGLSGTTPDVQPERRLAEVDLPIRRGDSGAPVVDEEGRAVGMVLLRYEDGGLMAPAEDIRRLAGAAGVDVGEGRSAKQFRAAMQSLWDLELEEAGARLEDTLETYPDHALAQSEASRVERLSVADYRLTSGERSTGFLVALATAALLAAILCGVRLGQLWARAASDRTRE